MVVGPRVLVVPGGTEVAAVAAAHAALRSMVERREAGAEHAGHTVVVLRDPALVDPSTRLAGASTPAAAFPELPPQVLADPHLLDGVDLVVPTSGSTAGSPRLVGLPVSALIASARATADVIGGPGRWILALPAHHIGGAQVLFRAALAGTTPHVVDTSHGFDPSALVPAVAGATHGDLPGYLSLVPAQLRACLQAGEEVTGALARLGAVLVGGSGLDPAVREAARGRGIPVVSTYGMTETAGGCVYDGIPLPGVAVRTVELEGHSRLAISGPTLMTRYLGHDAPFFEEVGKRWLLTGDLGIITAAGMVEVLGRSDEVIVSGGLSIAPAPVRRAVLSTPGVRDAWIIATPDPKWDMAVTAVVVPESGLGVDTWAGPADEGGGGEAPTPQLVELAQRIRDHVGGILGRVQSPRVVVAVPELPMLPSGKVDRARVHDLALARIGTRAAWRR